MTSLQKLEKEIEGIRARNSRVEADKAWEISGARRIFIGISTYALIALFMIIIGLERPFISAIIPAAAYLISTFSLGVLKTWWLKRRN